jgi:mannosyltransferase
MKFKKAFLYLGPLLIIVFISISISVSKSIWRDEAFSILISQKSFTEIVKSSAADVSPPLFYILLKGWQQLVGKEAVALRIFPLIFSVATAALLYLVKPFIIKVVQKQSSERGLKFFNLTYLLLVALNAGIIYFSAELRTYSLLMFLALTSITLLYLSISKGRLLWLVLLTAVNGAMLYTHNFGILWLVSQVLAVFLIKPYYQKI